MNILRADLQVPWWCSFRVPQSVNVHLTYPVPPPTTLYGLVANALGLPQDDYSWRSRLQFGVRILKRGSLIETYTQWQKWNPSKNAYTMLVTKQKLLKPAYRLYIGGEANHLEHISDALKDPARILYLGESDDVVEVHNVMVERAEVEQHDTLDSIAFAPKLHGKLPKGDDIDVMPLPLTFTPAGRGNYDVQYEMAYVGKMLTLDAPVPCYFMPRSGETVVLEGADPA